MDELDEFNDETFGQEEIGDWEIEHDRFVANFDSDELPPNACEIPRFWETENSSVFWESGDVDVGQSFECLNLEENINRIVCDDDFEDPAIINVSKRLPSSKKNTSILSHIGGSVFSTNSNIWCSEKSSSKGNSRASKDRVDELSISSEDASIEKLKETSQKPHWLLPTPFPLPNIPDRANYPPSIESARNNEDYLDLNNPSTLHVRPTKTNVYPHWLPAPCPVVGQPPRVLFQTLPPLSIPPPRFGLQYINPPFLPPNLSNFPVTFPAVPLNFPTTGMMRFAPINLDYPYFRHSAHSINSITNFPLVPLINESRSFPAVTLVKRENVTSLQDFAIESDDEEFDPESSCWMHSHERALVLHFQLRSLTVGNPYVEDYYFAVKWLSWMAKQRKRVPNPMLSTIPLPFYLNSPISSLSLLNPDHHHHIGTRARFIIASRKNSIRPGDLNSSNEYTSLQNRRARLNSSTSSIEGSSPYSNQLGRPTKSNITGQRLIADLSISNALAEDEMMENPKDCTNSLSPKSENNRRTLHTAPRVIKQRRRLDLLARIERVYATILNIDETNVSIARIIIKNDELARLLEHRVNLLDHIHRDLFIISKPITAPETNNDSCEPSLPFKNWSLFIEIFEIPKGIRLLRLALRFLISEVGQFCVSEFISKFSRIHRISKASLDNYAEHLYTPIRTIIYKGCEQKKFIYACLPFLQRSRSLVDTCTLDENSLTMFSSKFGISLFFCLLDACAQLSNPNDPSLFCDLYFYACRIVDHLPFSDLALPLEHFARFSGLDPQFLMPDHLRVIFTERLQYCGVVLRQLSIGALPASNADVLRPRSASQEATLPSTYIKVDNYRSALQKMDMPFSNGVAKA